jgi:tetratricopeptide (TPR) repeat protein
MKSPLPLLGWCLLLAGPAAVLAQDPVTLPQPSPAASVSQTIGISAVTVVYHRPYVNQRAIWGGLVPYGYHDLGFGTAKAAPWRAGADENTLITFQNDVWVAGQALPAGTYGLFMALAPDGGVTVIFSKDTTSWGSFYYNEAHDALRVPSKLEDADFHEQLTYDFSAVTDTTAVLTLSWEKKRIPIPLKVDTVADVVANLKRELLGAKGFDYRAWVSASRYLMVANVELPLALEWADVAVSGREIGERNFATLSNKALALSKLGREDEAKTIMDGALKLGSATEIHQYGRALIAQGKFQRALEVYQLNAQLHPDVWPVNYGLARGYSAVGDYKAALQALLKAQTQVPEGDLTNANAVKINLEKLKRGENIN